MKATLLVELRTEELPPKSLLRLAEAFHAGVLEALKSARLAGAAEGWMFATPRRLAVLIPDVLDRAPDAEQELKGPTLKVGHDGDGKPTQALIKWAASRGVALEALEIRSQPKGDVFVGRVTVKGATLEDGLPAMVAAALAKLPVAKLMRWGAGEAQFVRPVHGLVMLHGERVIEGEVLGVRAGRTTHGHRFLGTGEITLARADAYAQTLAEDGRVIADFAARRADIEGQLLAEAKRRNASLGEYRDLLDEVTALVELPTVYAGTFDAAFLEVPQECLILTMRQNQKYFPLFGADGRLRPEFLIVSNMRVADPRHIISGNQRVVRPRLEDARFFYRQDRRQRLEERVPGLARVVYHNKLGSQLERVQRIKLLAGRIARDLGADPLLAERAAELAKADLLTGMVGEFPELQGMMGRTYALHDGEPAEVADAIETHYRPRFAGDDLPDGLIACAVALADKLDAMAGLFSVGQMPTGEKDPFGLRRAALGVVRILVENDLDLSVHALASAAFEPFKSAAPMELVSFLLDRFAVTLKELGFTTLQVDAVLSQRPVRLNAVPRQLEAVKAFQALPEAQSLAAANKRVGNLLRQAEAKGEAFTSVARGDLKEAPELALFDALASVTDGAGALHARGDYTGYLKAFAVLKAPVDAFFDSVMVMAEDPALRKARLALLRDLRDAMNRVADLSRLAA
ncbi:MAG: glycine--tRNA ligase subunit beta [Proteobacteria bacterium]|nr:glycine--tRNA ligase subunit beta [Pseudomonadota bacterium]